TLWPLPENEIRALADQVDTILVVEMNIGKLVKEIERVVCGKAKVASLAKVGGVLPLGREVLEEVRRLAK
ncbi:2-oxoacid:acceptor oxidoreductase subunit alpha, partial [Candidatus Bathyarchaeota archaeon]|nr:2-oxoacid:acceptor oxidoreductase subunit alpha [Candidatus Bathyarchaeota archaeon]